MLKFQECDTILYYMCMYGGSYYLPKDCHHEVLLCDNASYQVWKVLKSLVWTL